jgi:hypothetical protein
MNGDNKDSSLVWKALEAQDKQTLITQVQGGSRLFILNEPR